jgi:CrcB protein
MLRAFLFVGLGGAVGSMCRYGVTLLIGKVSDHHFPFATFLINMIGCLAIGVLFGLAQKNHWMNSGAWLVLATGFCGGFTTFSAFALENVTLLGKQQSGLAIVYSAISVVMGIVLCRAGIMLSGN